LAKSRLPQICKARNIWAVVNDRTRIAVHIHTRPSDIESFFAALKEAVA
jgi:thiamine monophosphate synthase